MRAVFVNRWDVQEEKSRYINVSIKTPFSEGPVAVAMSTIIAMRYLVEEQASEAEILRDIEDFWFKLSAKELGTLPASVFGPHTSGNYRYVETEFDPGGSNFILYELNLARVPQPVLA